MAPQQGMSDLAKLARGAPGHLHGDGWLVLEHGHRQGEQVRALLAEEGFDCIETRRQRYSRQLLMSDFDIEGQEKLQAATVLVVGLGGLGSPAAMYLAAAGVGRLLLADGDSVELSNLQRQIAHGESDIGGNKAQSAAASVAAHYTIRFSLNRACIDAAVPLVSAAAVRGEGQISVFDPVRGGPCYRCLYPDDSSDSALSCSQSGVVIGSLLAMEAIKVLSGYGESLRGALMLLDLKTMEFRKLKLPRRDDCPDCGHLHR